MSLFEDTNPRELKELLSQIHTREAALPDFQRDFVWDPNATQELIVSIASNYPAGSLLRIRNTHKLFACREFEDAPALDGGQPTYLVLDGQQRLTSLYQAFYGVGEHRYYLQVGRLIEGADFEEVIFHLRAKVKAARELQKFEAQATEMVLPLSVLKGSHGGFGRWAKNVARRIKADSERIKLEDRLSEVEERWIQAVDDYRFPVVTLSEQTSAEAVCTIFETLNRTGVKLSAYELLTARFWPQKVNLRQLWEAAREKHPIIEDFEIDPYYMLQAIALVSRPAPGCRKSDLLALNAKSIEQWWEKVAAGMAKGLEILHDDCGVILPKWLPYNTLLVPLAAMLARLGLQGKPAEGAARDKLCQWFWCSALGQTYDKASNSQAVKDFTDVIEWIKGGKQPDSVANFRFDPKSLRDVTPRQRALYCGAICLVLRHGPRDFHTTAKITGEMMIDKRVDDHHVFPGGYLREKVSGRLRDCVLNRTLIDRTTNIRIGKRAPSEYMGDIRRELGAAKFEKLLESHLLPGGKASTIWQNDFDSFLNDRMSSLWEQIQTVTGIAEASDLVDEEDDAG